MHKNTPRINAKSPKSKTPQNYLMATSLVVTFLSLGLRLSHLSTACSSVGPFLWNDHPVEILSGGTTVSARSLKTSSSRAIYFELVGLYCARRIIVHNESRAVSVFSDKSLEDVMRENRTGLPRAEFVQFSAGILSATEYLNGNQILYLLWTGWFSTLHGSSASCCLLRKSMT